jgi:radical SAM-linked protein
MKLAFGDALPVGMSSEGEYGDVRLHAPMDPESFVRRVAEACPHGLRVLAATTVDRSAPSLTSKVEAARYVVRLGRCGIDEERAREAVRRFLERTEVTVEKRVQKRRGVKVVRVDVRKVVRELRAGSRDGEAYLEAVIGRRSGNLGRPKELLRALFDLDPEGLLDAKVHKTDSYVEFDGRLVSVGAGWASGRFDPWSAPAPAAAAAV